MASLWTLYILATIKFTFNLFKNNITTFLGCDLLFH